MGGRRVTTESVLNPGKFSVDDLTPYFDGFDEPGKFWNGWRMPFFTEQIMLAIKAHIESDPGWADDPVIEYHPGRDPANRFEVVETEDKYRSTVHAVNIDGVWLWALGDGWCWVAERKNAR